MQTRTGLVRLATVVGFVAALVIGCGSGPLITISRDTATTTATPAEQATAEPTPSGPTPAEPTPAEPTPAEPTPTAAPTVVPTTVATAPPAPTPTRPPVVATPDPTVDGFPGWLRVNGFGPVDFGSNQSFTRIWIAPRFGEPASIFTNPECGLTILEWTDFSLAFESDKLVGWFYRSSNPGLLSPSGVAPGITASDLRIAYQGVEIFESSLGREFFFEVPAGFMGGFFGDGGQRVTEMFAGQNCFFR